MKTKLCFVLFVLMSFQACERFSSDIKPQKEITNLNPINFSKLENGQKSYFLRYQSACASPQNFHYTGDTLIVEVLKENEQTAFKEYFTPHSPLYLQGFVQDTVQYSAIELQNQQLLLPNRSLSALFYFYGNDTITLAPPKRVDLHQQNCKLNIRDNEPFMGAEFGKVNSFKVGEINLANKTAVSCIPTFLFLNSAYLIYDEHQLYLSHTSVISGNESESINGWVLLE